MDKIREYQEPQGGGPVKGGKSPTEKKSKNLAPIVLIGLAAALIIIYLISK